MYITVLIYNLKPLWTASTSFSVMTTNGLLLCKYLCMVITSSKGKDQPGKVANPARGS